MKFHCYDLALGNLTLTPRYDLDVDGSFTAFDLTGADPFWNTAHLPAKLTLFKALDGTLLLRVKPRRQTALELRGTCSEAEARQMDAVYAHGLSPVPAGAPT